LVADGSEEKARARSEEGLVFKTGVPISVVDDGDWSVNERGTEAELAEEIKVVDPVRKQDPQIDADVPKEEDTDTGEPVVVRRAAEAFLPETREYNEMPISLGDVVYAFESLEQNGWVYGYKQNEKNEVFEEGWLPLALLVPLDLEISYQEQTDAPAPPDHEDKAGKEEVWKSSWRRPAHRRLGQQPKDEEHASKPETAESEAWQPTGRATSTWRSRGRGGRGSFRAHGK